jgi:hypothetical protein
LGELASAELGAPVEDERLSIFCAAGEMCCRCLLEQLLLR